MASFVSFTAGRVIRTSEIEPTLRAKLAFTSGKRMLDLFIKTVVLSVGMFV